MNQLMTMDKKNGYISGKTNPQPKVFRKGVDTTKQKHTKEDEAQPTSSIITTVA